MSAMRFMSTLPCNGDPVESLNRRHCFRCCRSIQPRASFSRWMPPFRKFSSTEAMMNPRDASSSPR